MKGRPLTDKEKVSYKVEMGSLEKRMDEFIFGFKKKWRIEESGLIRLYFGNKDGYTKFGFFLPIK